MIYDNSYSIVDFIYKLIDSFVGFVRRNPVLCLVLLFIALASPQMLAGAFKAIIYVIMFFLILMLAIGIYLSYRFNRLRQDAEQKMRNASGSYRSYGHNTQQPREGEVSVHQTEPQEKKINKDVGDYVDFEDIGPKK